MKSEKITLLFFVSLAIFFAIQQKTPPQKLEPISNKTKEKKTSLHFLSVDHSTQETKSVKKTSSPLKNPTLKSPSPLEKLLLRNPKEKELLFALLDLKEKNHFIPDDIKILKNLYQNYLQNTSLRTLIISCLGTLKKEEVFFWLQDILWNPFEKMDQISILGVLGNYPQGKDLLQTFFHRENDFSLLSYASYELAEMALDDREVYNTLYNKFQESPSSDLQKHLIIAMGKMNIPNQAPFFEMIISSPRFDPPVRSYAIEALCIHLSPQNDLLRRILLRVQLRVSNTRLNERITEILERLP